MASDYRAWLTGRVRLWTDASALLTEAKQRVGRPVLQLSIVLSILISMPMRAWKEEAAAGGFVNALCDLAVWYTTPAQTHAKQPPRNTLNAPDLSPQPEPEPLGLEPRTLNFQPENRSEGPNARVYFNRIAIGLVAGAKTAPPTLHGRVGRLNTSEHIHDMYRAVPFSGFRVVVPTLPQP